MLNYYSYAVTSTAYALSSKCRTSDGKPFDVVFCNQLSPVMMAHAAIGYKKRYKVPAIMYCLDLGPESLIAGGITRESLIYKYYHHVSKRIYRQVDKILITSRMFSDYFKSEFGIRKDRIEYLPQYAEDIFEEMPIKEENGIFDFMFAGNIGTIQSVETILEAANLLKDEPVRFHIIGGGTDLERLQKIGKNLENVEFYGRKPLEEMPDFYKRQMQCLLHWRLILCLVLLFPGRCRVIWRSGNLLLVRSMVKQK